LKITGSSGAFFGWNTTLFVSRAALPLKQKIVCIFFMDSCDSSEDSTPNVQ